MVWSSAFEIAVGAISAAVERIRTMELLVGAFAALPHRIKRATSFRRWARRKSAWRRLHRAALAGAPEAQYQLGGALRSRRGRFAEQWRRGAVVSARG